MLPIESEADFDRMLRSAKALAVISAWNEGGLFQALEAGPLALSQLPGETRALKATASVLRHMGMLVGDSKRVALSPLARQLLESHALPTARNFSALADLSRMPEVLNTGKPVEATNVGVSLDPEHNRRFMQMLHRRSEPSAAATLEWTVPLLPDDAHVLDLGGGHGRYAASYVEAGYQATLFDRPEVIPIAREIYEDRIAYIEGDFLREDSLGGPYDLVLMSNIVHGLSAEQNVRLLRNVATSLKAGGHVVLKDFFLDPSGRFDERAAFFGMTMLFYTEGGGVYDHGEVSEWLLATGFEAPRTVALDSFELILAQRSRA